MPRPSTALVAAFATFLLWAGPVAAEQGDTEVGFRLMWVTGSATAGTVWLWDSADRSRRVGVVSGDSTAQPLLSDIHYVRKALEPFATISEGELVDLIDENPDAIILTDIGQIDRAAQTALRKPK